MSERKVIDMAIFLIGLAVGILIGQVAMLFFVGVYENNREYDIYNAGYDAGKKEFDKMK